MTIESTRSHEDARTSTVGTHRAGAKPGQSGAVGLSAGQGFAGVMGLLTAAVDGSDASDMPLTANTAMSASDVTSLASVAIVPGLNATLPDIGDTLPVGNANLALKGVIEKSDKNVSLAIDDIGLVAMNVIPNILVAAMPTLPPEVPAAASLTIKVSAHQPAGKWRPTDKPDTTLANSASTATPKSGHDAAPDVAALLGNRPAAPATGISQVQAQLREVKTSLQAPAPVTEAAASHIATAMASLQAVPGLPERQEAKHSSVSSGSGLEGALGNRLADKLGISPTYEVAPATAVVPDTQVAETVSYWATHGVQSAELTLDGLGRDPVKVRISVEGDQTQVDFRSNQPEVRQVLENASAQLKAMLSGEGLQLTGMSVGTSAQGQAQSDDRQAKPASRQTKLVALEPASATTGRSSNPSVGRALDLYV